MAKNNKNFVTAFKEYQHFNAPWDVEIVKFPTQVITPPHYGESIEVLLCDNLDGTANINGRIIPLHGKQILFIASDIVHGMNYNISDGTLTVIKLDPARLNEFVNIPSLLYNMNKHSFDTLPHLSNNFNEVSHIPDLLTDASVDIMSKFIAIISLFRAIASTSEHNTHSINESMHSIYKIITWTEKNCFRPISLEEVALISGYSKNYFCNKFKVATGVTYNTYLNNLRIYHACKMLESGFSIQDACSKCGFEDISYFIQLFKKTMGITPKQYSLTAKHTE